mgnify:CR=1 FL=1
MKKFQKGLVTCLAVATFAIPAGLASAASVAGGELVFKGGQTDTTVYSDIRDAKVDNDKKYMVWAAVKVGSSTYSSGWKEDKAYKQANRSFWLNETSHYDYYKR